MVWIMDMDELQCIFIGICKLLCYILCIKIFPMYTYIYLHTQTHTHMYVHAHTYTHTHIHIYIYTHTRTCAHAHRHIYVYTYVYTYVYMSRGGGLVAWSLGCPQVVTGLKPPLAVRHWVKPPFAVRHWVCFPVTTGSIYLVDTQGISVWGWIIATQIYL